MSELTEELYELSLLICRETLEGNTSVQGAWATLADNAADRINELEAQVEGLKKICFDYSLTGFDVEIQTAIDALTSPCQSHDLQQQSEE